MGDEANLGTPFPFFFDLPEDVAKKKRADRYDQLRNIFKHEIGPEGLPDPNDPLTFEMAKIQWCEYSDRPERRAALDRFRLLTSWRRERLWPLSGTPCLDARTARQGNCLIVNWTFEAGVLTMALNPTAAPADINCTIVGTPLSTGEFSQRGEVLQFGAWSAVAW
jgi:1,4-alpha-glucan branching enzyme